MRQILFALGLMLLSLTAHAQVVTNITLSIKVVDGSGTNTVTINAPTNYVTGFVINWQKNIANNGTNAPTFPNFVRQEVTDRLRGLNDDAVAQQIAANKVAIAAAQIATLWPSMTLSDQTNIAAILQKYVP